MSRMTDRRRLAVAALGLAALTALAGCGKQGPLERPAPLFGSRARAEYEAEKAQEARDDAQRRAQAGGSEAQSGGQPSPTTRDVLDPNQRLTPASRAPTPGAPNPLGSPVSPLPPR